MKILEFLAIAILLGGCNAVAQTPNPVRLSAHVEAQPPTRSAELTSKPNPSSVITGDSGEAQGRFKIRLTLAAPEDLKVKEGDIIIAGQIVADKVRDRTRLGFERDGIKRELGTLRQQLNAPLPGVKALPSVDFQEEAARIETARQSALELVRQREQQQRKLDVLANLEPGEVPEEIQAHELVALEEYQRQENQAQAEVNAAVGKLSRAKELRQREEYEHSLELSKRAIAIRDSELKTQSAIADLEARLSQVEIALSQLSAVRSPYSGRIQRIKFVGQSDTALTVELYLIVSGQRPGSGDERQSNRAN